MATIEEYRKQKILAEQLRKREAALGAAIQSGDPTLVTRGSRGATYDMPDIYQANIAGALGKVGGGYLAGRAGGKATEAETATEASRQAALEQVLGGTGMQSGTMTPQQAIQLQELGIDVNPADFMTKPKTPAPGAILQAIQSGLPPAIAQKVARGEDLTPDEIMAVQTAQKEKYDRELADKMALKRAGVAGAAPKLATDKQIRGQVLAQYLAATTPEEKARLKAQLKEIDSLAGDSGISPQGEKAAIGSEAVADLADKSLGELTKLKTMMESPKGKRPFTLEQGIAQSVTNLGIPIVSDVAKRQLAPESKMVNRVGLGLVLNDMKALSGADSNEELANLKQRQAMVGDDYDSAMGIINDAIKFQKAESAAQRAIAAARRDGTYDPSVQYYSIERARVEREEGGLAPPAKTVQNAGATTPPVVPPPPPGFQ